MRVDGVDWASASGSEHDRLSVLAEPLRNMRTVVNSGALTASAALLDGGFG